MFDNIGKKTMMLAEVIAGLGILSSVIIAIFIWVQAAELSSWSQEAEKAALNTTAFVVLIGGSLGSWISSFALYAIGQIAEDVSDIKARLPSISFTSKKLSQKRSQKRLIYFGKYPQTKDPQAKSEAITWRVLSREGEKALIISEKCLDCRPYNITKGGVTWETSTLGAWLNGEFLNTAFSERERQTILITTVKNTNNPEYGTEGGQDVQDMVFLLSIDEVGLFFEGDESRMAQNTFYAQNEGASDNDGFGWWWLRSPGKDSISAATVEPGGSILAFGSFVGYENFALRPALYLNLNSDIFESDPHKTANL